jgi:hypothetical protein
MKAQRREVVQLHSFLTLALDGIGQLHALELYLWGKNPWYPLNMRPQSWCQHFGEQINFLPLSEIESQIIQPMA